jgi:large subunit ribosomal protein L27e
MGKFIKSGKVVVMLAGRYAGKKAVVVKTYEEGEGDRKFGHCLVAGINRYPRKITRSMSKKKQAKRSKIKPFVKYVNFNHMMPTRYQINDLELKKVVNEDVFASKEQEGQKAAALSAVKKVFEDRYQAQNESKSQKSRDGAKYFFQKLRF